MKSLSVLFMLFCLLATGVALAVSAPRASVDRSIVSEGDSITLTIRVDSTGSFDEPDYSTLERDFQVYGSSESSQHMLNNGHLESWTEWQTTLLPKHVGELTIPALTVAGGQTQPLSIRVEPASATSAENSDEPVFIEAQLDRQSVYVQQQLLLTVRIFHAIQLDDMHLSEPTFDNASVRKVNETTFRRDIKGSTYLVHELTYAIFPQQPGELTIPELVFNAVQPLARRSLFDFPGQGRALRKMSKQMRVAVKPIPKSFSGAVWLPAKNLTLVESRNDKANNIAVGDSLTRSISMRADGLLAAQLPTLDAPKLDNAKIYNDQPTLDDQQDASGVHGKRIENMALIPTKPGDLQLPEVRVVWWDVESDSEKVATLPPSTLRIAAGAQNGASAPTNNGSATNTVAPATATKNSPDASAATAEPAAIAIAPQSATPMTVRGWQAACALLALVWLFTLYGYWKLRRKLQQSSPSAAISANANGDDEKAAFEHLKTACRANDPDAARAALLTWGQRFYREAHPATLDRLLHISASDLLTREVRQLDNRLFGTKPESGAWNGENLLAVVRELRAQRPDKATATRQLPPLYPAA